ncbi:MAG TPA: TetR family transcriptional regulator C-terminal domain-containing protein [Ilumatobacter sp.]|nr:TetR family transcriptional regulator C-terminal domain-containing protein [Ilumatobacter sp.]
MPVPTRQAERTERSTEALLDAAAELIAEGGLASMTFAAIGERAGYSRGLVTARFGSRAGLVNALVSRTWGQFHVRRAAITQAGQPAFARLMSLVTAIRQYAQEDPRNVRALFALMFEALGPDEALRERMAQFHQAMRDDIAALVEAGRADGSISPSIDPQATALILVALLRGLAYQWMLDPVSVDLAAAYDVIHEQVGNALAAPDRSKSS